MSWRNIVPHALEQLWVARETNRSQLLASHICRMVEHPVPVNFPNNGEWRRNLSEASSQASDCTLGFYVSEVQLKWKVLIGIQDTRNPFDWGARGIRWIKSPSESGRKSYGQRSIWIK